MTTRRIITGIAVAFAILVVSLPFSLSNAAQRGQRGSPGTAMEAAPGEETMGNNLSTPVIFAEGIGLTGDPLAFDTGLRPRPGEPAASAELPFLVDLDPEWGLYLQQTLNCWRAEFEDGSNSESGVMATVDWSDNLVRQTWTTRSVIRVEVVLHELLDANGDPIRPDLMFGYPTVYAYGEGRTEMYGVVDDMTLEQNATIFSVCPRLVIAKLLENGDEVVMYEGSIADGLGSDGPGYYNAEINVAGKVIYGYNWFLNRMNTGGLPKEGWWRIYFIVDPQVPVGGEDVASNVFLTNLHPGDLDAEVLHPPVLVSGENVTFIDIEIVESRKGGRPPRD